MSKSKSPIQPGETGTDEATNARLDNVESNERFVALMQRARALGQEHCPEGVVTTPATERPVYTPSRPLLFSRGGSPAAQCAELGASGGGTIGHI